jgi:hypothetical protein
MQQHLQELEMQRTTMDPIIKYLQTNTFNYKPFDDLKNILDDDKANGEFVHLKEYQKCNFPNDSDYLDKETINFETNNNSFDNNIISYTYDTTKKNKLLIRLHNNQHIFIKNILIMPNCVIDSVKLIIGGHDIMYITSEMFNINTYLNSTQNNVSLLSNGFEMWYPCYHYIDVIIEFNNEINYTCNNLGTFMTMDILYNYNNIVIDPNPKSKMITYYQMYSHLFETDLEWKDSVKMFQINDDRYCYFNCFIIDDPDKKIQKCDFYALSNCGLDNNYTHMYVKHYDNKCIITFNENIDKPNMLQHSINMFYLNLSPGWTTYSQRTYYLAFDNNPDPNKIIKGYVNGNFVLIQGNGMINNPFSFNL